MLSIDLPAGDRGDPVGAWLQAGLRRDPSDNNRLGNHADDANHRAQRLGGGSRPMRFVPRPFDAW